MHPSALENARRFFDTYCQEMSSGSIVDIGSANVNGSIRWVAPRHFDYCGVDFAAGRGVDIVLDDPYELPIETGSVDVVVSSSCFEHSEMFWLLFLEALRILKPSGLLFLNVPTNSHFHRHPVDCWRFYPDSGAALVTWARRNLIDTVLLETFVSHQWGGTWNDCVSVFLRSESELERFPQRIVDGFDGYANGYKRGESSFQNFSSRTQDQNGLAARLREWWWRRREKTTYMKIIRR